MKAFVLALFLIVFGCKLIDVQGIVYKFTGRYTSIDSQLTMSSEELETESDEQKKSKFEEDDVFYLPSRNFLMLISFSLYKTILQCCKTLSGFISQFFSPPDLI